MNINRVDCTKFNGIYKVPNNKAYIEALNREIMPAYSYVRHDKPMAVIGENPFQLIVEEFMKITAKENNSSIDWLKQNIKNHGGNTDNVNQDFIYLFTLKDKDNFMGYLIPRIEAFANKYGHNNSEKGIKGFFKRFFKKEEPEKLVVDENTPKHLRVVFQALHYNDEEVKNFHDYVDNKIVEVKSPMDLFVKMMNEH